MTNSSTIISQTYLRRILWKSSIVTFLCAVGLLSGLAPDLSVNTPSLMFSSTATAQAVSDDEVAKFARTALTIERRRQAVVEEIKNRTGGNVPEITCDSPDRLDSLPDNIREDVRNFCEFSRQTIQANQLTVGRFLQIRNTQANDSTLKQRIERELLRLQSGS